MLPSKSKKGLLKLGRQHSSFNAYKEPKQDTCKRCGSWLTDIPLSINNHNEDVFARRKGYCLECFIALNKKGNIRSNIPVVLNPKIKNTFADKYEQDKSFCSIINTYGMDDDDIQKIAIEKLGYTSEDIKKKRHLSDYRLGYKCTCLATREGASR